MTGTPQRTGRMATMALLLCLLSGPVLGQESPMASPAEGPSEIQMVLLRSGEILEGKVLQRGDLVQVKLENGFRSFTAADVRVIGKDKNDLYDKLDRQIPSDSVAGRMALARWCAQQGLKTQQIKELRLILALDSKNEEAKTMMEEFVDYNPHLDNVVVVDLPSKSQKLKYKLQKFETLAGLPAPIAREFTSGVQPIVKKKCGGLSCHGGERESSFQLSMHPGVDTRHRDSSAANFEAIVALVNLDNPVESELFTIGRNPHADMKSPVFGTDRSSQIQLQRIYEWIITAKPHLEKLREDDARQTERLASAKEPGLLDAGQGGNNPDARADQQQQRIQQVNAETTTGQMQEQVEVLEQEGFNGEVAEDIIKQARPDQFDPAIFNRRFRR